MPEYNQKLLQILQLLGTDWIVDDFQLAGMGWFAVMYKEGCEYTLHSERGWVDIYLGSFKDQNKVGCEIEAKKIAEKIVNAIA